MTEFESRFAKLAEPERQLTELIAEWIQRSTGRKVNQFVQIRSSCGDQTLLLLPDEKTVDKGLLRQVFDSLSVMAVYWEPLCEYLRSEPNNYVLRYSMLSGIAPDSTDENRITGVGSFESESTSTVPESDIPSSFGSETTRTKKRFITPRRAIAAAAVIAIGIVGSRIIPKKWFGPTTNAQLTAKSTSARPEVQTQATRPADPLVVTQTPRVLPDVPLLPRDLAIKQEADNQFTKAEADHAAFLDKQAIANSVMRDVSASDAENVRLNNEQAALDTEVDQVTVELENTLTRLQNAADKKRGTLDLKHQTVNVARELLKMLKTPTTVAASTVADPTPQSRVVSTPEQAKTPTEKARRKKISTVPTPTVKSRRVTVAASNPRDTHTTPIRFKITQIVDLP